MRFIGCALTYLIALPLSCGAALASQDCTSALVKDEVVSNSSEVVRLSALWSVSEEAYNSAQSAAGTSGDAFFGAFGGAANYNEFKSNVNKRAEELGIQNFTNRALSYATSGLGLKGLEAYKSCLRFNQTAQLHVVVEQIGENTYVVSLVFASPAVPMEDTPGQLVHSTNLSEAEKDRLNTELSAIVFGRSGVDRHLLIEPQQRSEEVAVEFGAGTSASQSILLPPLQAKEGPPPPHTSERQLREELRNGAPGRLTFEPQPCKDLGTIQCGYEYSVQYDRITNGWRMAGNNKDGVWVDETYKNARKPGGNPRGHLSAWGIQLEFFSSGEVRREHQTIGKLELVP